MRRMAFVCKPSSTLGFNSQGYGGGGGQVYYSVDVAAAALVTPGAGRQNNVIPAGTTRLEEQKKKDKRRRCLCFQKNLMMTGKPKHAWPWHTKAGRSNPRKRIQKSTGYCQALGQSKLCAFLFFSIYGHAQIFSDRCMLASWHRQD